MVRGTLSKRNNFFKQKVKRKICTLMKQENFIDRKFTRAHLILNKQIIQKKYKIKQRLNFSRLASTCYIGIQWPLPIIRVIHET